MSRFYVLALVLAFSRRIIDTPGDALGAMSSVPGADEQLGAEAIRAAKSQRAHGEEGGTATTMSAGSGWGLSSNSATIEWVVADTANQTCSTVCTSYNSGALCSETTLQSISSSNYTLWRAGTETISYTTIDASADGSGTSPLGCQLWQELDEDWLWLTGQTAGLPLVQSIGSQPCLYPKASWTLQAGTCSGAPLAAAEANQAPSHDVVTVQAWLRLCPCSYTLGSR